MLQFVAYFAHPVHFLLPQRKIRNDLKNYPSGLINLLKRQDVKGVVRKNGQLIVKHVKWRHVPQKRG